MMIVGVSMEKVARLALDGGEKAVRGEVGEVGVGRAGVRERRAEEVRGMEHRGDVQHHVVLEGAVRPHELEPVRGDVPVGEPHPLGAAGGPPGMEEERVVALDAGPPRVLRRGVAERFVDGVGITPAVLADPQPRLPPRGEHGVGREPGQVVLHREEAGRRAVEDLRDLARREPVVDGDRDRAHPVAGMDELGLARVVAAEDREPVSLPHPERTERPRRPPHPDRELRPGEGIHPAPPRPARWRGSPGSAAPPAR